MQQNISLIICSLIYNFYNDWIFKQLIIHANSVLQQYFTDKNVCFMAFKTNFQVILFEVIKSILRLNFLHKILRHITFYHLTQQFIQ